MCKILITGSLGYIGSHLLHYLDYECKITAIDNFLTQRYCSLSNICSNNNQHITFKEQDFKDLTVSELNNYDVVIHLAAVTNAAQSFNNKEELERININQTKDLIDKVETSNVKKFIFASSTSVYGKAAVLVDEDGDYENPQSPYAESKLEIEQYLKDNCDKYYILRLGTVTGQSLGIRYHTCVPKFCYQAALRQELTVWKYMFKKHRPYCSLIDITQAIDLILDNEIEINDIYNVLTDNKTPEEIIETIRLYVPDVRINFVDTPLLNQFNYKVSNAKIKKQGFEVMGDIDKDIQEMFYFFEIVRK